MERFTIPEWMYKYHKLIFEKEIYPQNTLSARIKYIQREYNDSYDYSNIAIKACVDLLNDLYKNDMLK